MRRYIYIYLEERDRSRQLSYKDSKFQEEKLIFKIFRIYDKCANNRYKWEMIYDTKER